MFIRFMFWFAGLPAILWYGFLIGEWWELGWDGAMVEWTKDDMGGKNLLLTIVFGAVILLFIFQLVAEWACPPSEDG